MTLEEIIALGGLIELTGPLMIFVELEEKDGLSPDDNDIFAIVWLKECSTIKIDAVKGNGVFGSVLDAKEAWGCVPDEASGTGVSVPVEPSELINKRFITSAIELDRAIITRAKK